MRTILTVLGRLLRARRVPASKRIVLEMEREAALLREKIRYLQVMAMRPGQSSKDLERCIGLNVRRGPKSRRVVVTKHGTHCLGLGCAQLPVGSPIFHSCIGGGKNVCLY